MTIHLYGIPNCDTVKKARKWLESQELEYTFHDLKKEGVDAENLKDWIGAKGVDLVLNRRGTTYRKLSDADKVDIDEAKAVTLLQEHSSMIKRPVAVHGNGILIGFKEEEWSAAFS
ncbi:MAG: arsenate reductase [Pseudomonadota bacterium]